MEMPKWSWFDHVHEATVGLLVRLIYSVVLLISWVQFYLPRSVAVTETLGMLYVIYRYWSAKFRSWTCRPREGCRFEWSLP